MRTLFVYGDVFRAHNYVDNSAKVFNIPHYFPIHNEAEIAVAVDDCPAAIRELMRVVEELMIPANYVTEVSLRFILGGPMCTTVWMWWGGCITTDHDAAHWGSMGRSL